MRLGHRHRSVSLVLLLGTRGRQGLALTQVLVSRNLFVEGLGGGWNTSLLEKGASGDGAARSGASFSIGSREVALTQVFDIADPTRFRRNVTNHPPSPQTP